MHTDGDVAEGADFDVVGSRSPTPGSSRGGQQDLLEGVCGFFSIIPEGADGAGERAGWGAGMLSQGRGSIPQESLASSLLQANPLTLVLSPFPSEGKTLPARAGLVFKLIIKLIFKLIPIPNKLLGSVPPGHVSAPIIS